MAERLAIAQVTPFAWETYHEVNESVAAVSHELAARGHRVLIVAPSQSAAQVSESRRAIRGDSEALLERAQDGPVVLAVGEVLPFSPARRRAGSLPVDVARTIEELLSSVSLDIVHVHEPFAPSASSAALRHSRALNVGSFHLPTERVLSKQLARPLSRLLFGRLDGRIASYQATADLLRSYFPGEYEVIRPGSDLSPSARADGDPDTVELLACGLEERAAVRTFIRALRALPQDPSWHATIWSPGPLAVPATLSARLRERIDVVQAETVSQAEALTGADVLVLASDGLRPAPDLLGMALAAGVVPVAARLPVYEELLQEGQYGFQFEPGDAQTLASQLERLVSDPDLVTRCREQILNGHPTPSWSEVTDQIEDLYGRLTARRHDAVGDRRIKSRLSSRPLIDVDLHMHTDHSYDCATPVEVLLAEARARGLGAIAITDHNEISGALEARAKADGIKVIVAEEVKTADQGEVIGLFIEEKIPRGLSLEQTIAEIKRQGGLVYVPHPFDRLHSVPDYEHLLQVLDDVDAIEVFNPRVAISEFNEEAVRFAAKYRIPAGAGSDAHVPQGLGSVRIRMRDFEGPQEFLQALRDADIVRNPASLLYVQALKFLQTKALPAPARRAARDRRVRRATGRRAGRGSGARLRNS
ncbi:MAG TPA: glycosyltransferase [Solirubrobacteraceae bacterium]|nr:glycosyltransferase [Solirubrobacteraceae bacterium]